MNSPAAIYCRISHDEEGRGLGVARQEEDCRALADRVGVDIYDVYTDNDVGASTRSRRKRRPEYERMLDDARSGRVAVILAYSNSRLTRRLMELEDLIRLHEQHGTVIETVVSGNDDLSTADGRMVARIKASVDAAEAERTAERVTRAHLQNAQDGIPVGGTRPFGWREDKRQLDPRESQLLRAAAADLLDGRSAVAIARDWNATGTRTPRGLEWTGEAVKQVLRSPRVAGWRVYRGGIAVGRDGQPVVGAYEPVLDDGTWRAVVATLRQPERRSRIPRKGSRHYLMTGLLRCAECGGAMYGGRETRTKADGTHVETHSYRCDSKRSDPGGHGNAISGGPVDALVAQWVVGASETISDVDLASVEQAEESASVAAELTEVTAMIDELMSAYRDRTLSAAVVFKSIGALEERRDTLEARRDELDAARSPERIDAATWDQLDIERRRAVVERWLEVVYVRRAETRSNRFNAARLDPVWRTP